MRHLTTLLFKKKALVILPITVSLLLASLNNQAEEGESTNYNASFFSQYLPQNALDMVNRLPGFSFDQGSNERGFGGNAGNVLIEGARPTSKSGGIREALLRIPADQVLRIELIRGGVSSGEAAGQSLVANIIKVKGGTSGTWDYIYEGNIGEELSPRISSSLSTQIGEWQTSFNTILAKWTSHRTAEISNFDQQQSKISTEAEDYKNSQKWFRLTGEGTTNISGGKLSVNGYLNSQIWKRDSRQNIDNLVVQDQSQLNESLNQDNRGTTIELGVDWTKNYDHWKVRLIGLGVSKNDVAINRFESRSPIDDSYASFDRQDSSKTELVTRTTFAGLSDNKFKPEFGFEITNNKLDSALSQFQNGVLQPSQANDDVQVEEIRAEIFANFSYQFDQSLTFEGGLTAELSKIEVDSLNSKKQNFSFLKPRISSTYELGTQTQLSVELSHKVGQLNFNDFATSNEAFDGITNTGNSDLMPDQTTEFATTYDWSFSERGSLKVKVFHQWRKDILEQVIIADAENNSLAYGLGNAGKARFWGIKTDLNFPTDYLLADSLLQLSHQYQGSDFYDQTINENRSINNYIPNKLELNFRQDFIEEKLAWGIGYINNNSYTNYRVNEIQQLEVKRKYWLFIESTKWFGLKTYFELNAAGEESRTRAFYQNNRNGAVIGNQHALRKTEPVVVLRFSGTF